MKMSDIGQILFLKITFESKKIENFQNYCKIEPNVPCTSRFKSSKFSSKLSHSGFAFSSFSLSFIICSFHFYFSFFFFSQYFGTLATLFLFRSLAQPELFFIQNFSRIIRFFTFFEKIIRDRQNFSRLSHFFE